MQLDPKRLGLAGGIIWGLGVFLGVIISMIFGIGENFFAVTGDFWVGVELSFIGAIIGFIWGFIDGFVGFFLVAWIYNKLG
ncbi:MAG: bacteriophage holin [Chlamydiales bacterium]